jgi:hypothetical protein
MDLVANIRLVSRRQSRAKREAARLPIFSYVVITPLRVFEIFGQHFEFELLTTCNTRSNKEKEAVFGSLADGYLQACSRTTI